MVSYLLNADFNCNLVVKWLQGCIPRFSKSKDLIVAKNYQRVPLFKSSYNLQLSSAELNCII